MLLRWLIRSFCMTPAELRVVLAGVRAYREYRAHREYRPGIDGGHNEAWRFDRRISRSVRLSLLTGLLVVQADSPQVFATGWLALPLAAMVAMARLAGALR
ncbi:hypothetical protein [Paraburkholderia phenoliruptrix]|uniref:Uncharacterized protein n=2 Tax=Paraburkholderia phenoliruptrix TaxID=252970 RepID=K0DRC8_9BURK|nr:hypothetical protein [Paraburkholderia phenoliruptrix]AFT85989.1 hypothetical protein BUPH_02422 [Paraburkholderia phenoliruptrix BR3459a]CAB4048519.1 hypothetical protein LMG9964_02160 [Paraburkholderia phenoliruptrix]